MKLKCACIAVWRDCAVAWMIGYHGNVVNVPVSLVDRHITSVTAFSLAGDIFTQHCSIFTI